MEAWSSFALAAPLAAIAAGWQARGPDGIGFHQAVALWVIAFLAAGFLGLQAHDRPERVAGIGLMAMLAPWLMRITWAYRIPGAMRRRRDDRQWAIYFMATVFITSTFVLIGGARLVGQSGAIDEKFSLPLFLVLMAGNAVTALVTAWSVVRRMRRSDG